MKITSKSTIAMTVLVLIAFVFAWKKTLEISEENQGSAIRLYRSYCNEAQEWNQTSDDPYLVLLREWRLAGKKVRALNDENDDPSEISLAVMARQEASRKLSEEWNKKHFSRFDIHGSPSQNKQDWLDYSPLYSSQNLHHENLIYADENALGKNLLSFVANRLRKAQLFRWASYAAILGFFLSPLIAVMLCRVISRCIDAAYREHAGRLAKASLSSTSSNSQTQLEPDQHESKQ